MLELLWGGAARGYENGRAGCSAGATTMGGAAGGGRRAGHAGAWFERYLYARCRFGGALSAAVESDPDWWLRYGAEVAARTKSTRGILNRSTIAGTNARFPPASAPKPPAVAARRSTLGGCDLVSLLFIWRARWRDCGRMVGAFHQEEIDIGRVCQSAPP